MISPLPFYSLKKYEKNFFYGIKKERCTTCEKLPEKQQKNIFSSRINQLFLLIGRALNNNFESSLFEVASHNFPNFPSFRGYARRKRERGFAFLAHILARTATQIFKT